MSQARSVLQPQNAFWRGATAGPKKSRLATFERFPDKLVAPQEITTINRGATNIHSLKRPVPAARCFQFSD
jgi:hypothetical protein